MTQEEIIKSLTVERDVALETSKTLMKLLKMEADYSNSSMFIEVLEKCQALADKFERDNILLRGNIKYYNEMLEVIIRNLSKINVGMQELLD